MLLAHVDDRETISDKREHGRVTHQLGMISNIAMHFGKTLTTGSETTPRNRGKSWLLPDQLRPRIVVMDQTDSRKLPIWLGSCKTRWKRGIIVTRSWTAGVVDSKTRLHSQCDPFVTDQSREIRT